MAVSPTKKPAIEMATNDAFQHTVENADYKHGGSGSGRGVWTVCGAKENRAYSYEEAVDLAGNGSYTLSLLAVLSVTILSMGCDMFGFSVVVAGSSCDLQVTPRQRNILMSMPFLGPIIMSYPWGYFSDTQGRRKCLLLAMSCGFLASVLSALSPHWIMLAVLKFLSSSCCSCAQSATYALLGESSPRRVRGSHMLAMTSVLMLTPSYYYVIGYFIQNMEFSYSLGFIRFVPWRLLVLALVLPMGVSALALHAFYESPKFLANQGREDRAVEILAKIWRRNGGKDEYPVKKLILNEDSQVREEKQSFWNSVWEQTAPLFRLPLLWRSLQLYYLTAILYSINNSLLMWYPFIADAFIAGGSSPDADQVGGLCNMILSSQSGPPAQQVACSSKLEYLTMVTTVVHSVSFALVNALMSRLAARMRLMMIALLCISFLSGLGIIFTTNNLASLASFLGIMAVGLGIGLVFSYFIELYPTSYRGMAACLGVIVARGSSLVATNILGSYIMTHCHACFYTFTAYIFSGIVAAYFLPADGRKKT